VVLDATDNAALVATLAGGAGMGIGAIARARVAGRKVDKVDAVAAISAAYDRVIRRLEAQVDSLEQQVKDMRDEMIRRDGLFERMLEKIAQPVAVVAPIAPVAPVAPIAPRRHRKTDIPKEPT
jgi:predicted RNA methylase